MNKLQKPSNSNNALQVKPENQLDENSKLKSELQIKFKELNLLEQKSYLCYVEILGIPNQPNEDCVEEVQRIIFKMGLQISVVKAFRIFSKFRNKPSKLIAELMSFNQKVDLIRCIKQRKLNTRQLNSSWPYYQIYVNNVFTEYNKYLYKLCKSFAVENNYKHVWFYKWNIFIRKDNDSNEILIEDENDLLNIKKL